MLDARDPAFATLGLWSDTDGDRRSAPGELEPLARRVRSISLAFAVVPRCDARGDCERERSRMKWTDAAGALHDGAIVDVHLVYGGDVTAPRPSPLARR